MNNIIFSKNLLINIVNKLLIRYYTFIKYKIILNFLKRSSREWVKQFILIKFYKLVDTNGGIITL